MSEELCECRPLLPCRHYPYPNQETPPAIVEVNKRKEAERRRLEELARIVPLREKDSEERLREYLKITPAEARSVIPKNVPVKSAFDKCEIEDTVLSPALPRSVQMEYFPPHRLGATYNLLPLVQKEIRYEYFKKCLSFSEHPTFAREWDTFIGGLPCSRKLVATLPDKRNYHFHNNTSRYIEPVPRDIRKKMRAGPYIDSCGIQMPSGYGIMSFRTTKLSLDLKPKKRQPPEKKEESQNKDLHSVSKHGN